MDIEFTESEEDGRWVLWGKYKDHGVRYSGPDNRGKAKIKRMMTEDFTLWEQEQSKSV